MKNIINSTFNLLGYGLSIIQIYINIFGILTNIPNGYMIIHYINLYHQKILAKRYVKYNLSDKQILYSKIICITMVCIWIIRMGYQALFINTDSRTLYDSQTVVVTHQSVEPGEKVPHGTVVRVTLTDTDTSTNGRY